MFRCSRSAPAACVTVCSAKMSLSSAFSFFKLKQQWKDQLKNSESDVVLCFREVSPGNTLWAPKLERCSQTSPTLSIFCSREISPERRLVRSLLSVCSTTLTAVDVHHHFFFFIVSVRWTLWSWCIKHTASASWTTPSMSTLRRWQVRFPCFDRWTIQPDW